MAIVKATGAGVRQLSLAPNFKIKTAGMTVNFLNDPVHKLPEKQALLLGFRESLVTLMIQRYGFVLVHPKYLQVV